MDEKWQNSLFKKRRFQIITLFVSLLIFCSIYVSSSDGVSINMGTLTTVDGLETRWTEDYKLFIPGTIDKININTADRQTLEALPGVGEKLAKAIIEYRQEKGPFHSADEVVNISGIGIKKLNQMKDFIIVE